ncbi:proteasome activator complex subunit 1-like [Alexandromys fortis]|uniref:proteasome activator complex subunit 1-like n=1 Tax=Alexandromys fortis TaxID=100897 RepID=UPI00215299DB|nr:proteasome activator complex subunit 1-like [Microtus fortis]
MAMAKLNQITKVKIRCRVSGKETALLRLEDDSAVLDINYEGEATVSIHVQGVTVPYFCNEKIVVLLQRLKPEIKDVIEQLNLVTTWLQLQIPRIEDGNNFGVAVQEKVFELMTSLHTKLEGFHTQISQISKYFSEGGDAVAKAAKQPHVGDYRQLVHELDEAEYQDIRLMVMEIRNAYAVLYDIILKNFEKLKKPRGETKGMIY